MNFNVFYYKIAKLTVLVRTQWEKKMYSHRPLMEMYTSANFLEVNLSSQYILSALNMFISCNDFLSRNLHPGDLSKINQNVSINHVDQNGVCCPFVYLCCF